MNRDKDTGTDRNKDRNTYKRQYNEIKVIRNNKKQLNNY
jgi:hypothetical protein